MALSLTNKVLDPALCGAHYHLLPEIYVIFIFNDICSFWGNMKVLLEHLYTRWTYEGVNITQRLTK